MIEYRASGVTGNKQIRSNNMDTIKATWSVSLDCDCPNCKESVDLLAYPDFWDEHLIKPLEGNTTRSESLEVVCPECDFNFIVECK